MSELPKGWSHCKLQDIAEIKYGNDLSIKKISSEGKYPVFGANGIIGYFNDYMFEEEQVLISCRGAYSGKINLSPPKCHVTHNSLILEFNKELKKNKKYFYYAFQSLDKSKFVTGSAQPQVTIANAKLIEVAFASINEQKRIVEKLDKLLARVEKSKERLEKIPIILKRFRQSVLNAAVTGELTKDWRIKNSNISNAEKFLEYIIQVRKKNGLKEVDYSFSKSDELPEKWIKAKLAPFVESLANGIYKSEKYYSNDGIGCARMYNIQEGELNRNNLKRMILTKEEINKYELAENDMLVNRVNSRELVGKAAYIGKLNEKLIFESKNIRLRLLEKMIMPKYINYLFLTRIVRDAFEIDAKQTVGMATISQPQISSLIIPLPPLEEQKEVVKQIEALFKTADEIEARYKKAKVYVDKLTQSILAKAFRGELVPQDPNDEPAEKLLERVREEREKFKTKKIII